MVRADGFVTFPCLGISFHSPTPSQLLHFKYPHYSVLAMGGLLFPCPGLKGPVLTLTGMTSQCRSSKSCQLILAISDCEILYLEGCRQGQKFLNCCSAGHHRSIMSCLAAPHVLPSAASTWLCLLEMHGGISQGRKCCKYNQKLAGLSFTTRNKEFPSVLHQLWKFLLVSCS